MFPDNLTESHDTGDFVEQHPELSMTLLLAAIIILLLEFPFLRGPLRLIKGAFLCDSGSERFFIMSFVDEPVAWLWKWLFGPAIPQRCLVCDASAPSHHGAVTCMLGGSSGRLVPNL
jgi:hypothetical protein